jgi:hypothetical protein
MTRDTQLKLARIFSQLWTLFCEQVDLDEDDLHELLAESGLTTRRPATAEEAVDQDFCEGDEILVLADDGKAVVAMAREASNAD